MKKHLLYLAIAATTFPYLASAQTYEASYKMVFRGTIDIPFDQINSIAVATITVKCDSNFIEISGTLDTSITYSANFQDKVENKTSISVDKKRVIIDRHRKLAWYPKEKKMYRVKGYQLFDQASHQHDCTKNTVETLPNVTVITCKRLPPWLSPGILFPTPLRASGKSLLIGWNLHWKNGRWLSIPP